MIDLTGNVAVVTGGAGEIGASVTRTLASAGAEVHVLDTDVTRGSRLVDDIVSGGGSSTFSQVDATSAEAVRAAVSSIELASGRVDIAVAGVGWTAATPFLDEVEDYWRKIIDINLMSAIFLTHAVLPGMVNRHRGRIVLMSSLAGRIGRRERATYSAAKAGVIGFARAVALEVAALDITVNCIAPGATDTAQMRSQGEGHTAFALANIPRGIFASTEDQANAVAFLASDLAQHITGQVLAVDGGATMI